MSLQALFRNAKTFLCSSIYFLLLLYSGCSVGLVEDPMQLEVATPQYIRGKFHKGTTQINFEANITNRRFLKLSDSSGRLLLNLSDRGDGSSVLEISDTFRLYSLPLREEEHKSQWEGEPKDIYRLFQTSEFAILPALSKRLGMLGITGHQYPSAFLIHRLASQISESLGIRPQESDLDEATTYQLSRASSCEDLKGDPHTNGCFGMCGSGCDCWQWICGDCCSHPGCEIHDISCRKCTEDLSVTDCVRCTTGIMQTWRQGGGCFIGNQLSVSQPLEMRSRVNSITLTSFVIEKTPDRSPILFNISNIPEWVDVSPTYGYVAKDDLRLVSLKVKCRAEGCYTATLKVHDYFLDSSKPVALKIICDPEVVVGINPPEISTNNGRAIELDWGVSNDCDLKGVDATAGKGSVSTSVRYADKKSCRSSGSLVYVPHAECSTDHIVIRSLAEPSVMTKATIYLGPFGYNCNGK